MKKTKFLYKISAVLSIGVFVTACNMTDLDINTDPNNPSTAAPNLILATAITDGMSTFADDLNNAAHGFMRITTSYDTYQMTANTWNVTWNYLYSGPLKDLRDLKTSTEGVSPHYYGIAQILEAYYFSLMVDMWGDVPFDEAFLGNASPQNKKAAFQDDQAIYTALLANIDAGLTALDGPTPVTVNGDMIYGGSASKWTKFGNTLKLKLLLNMNEVSDQSAAIDALITEDNFIEKVSEYFVFTFTSSIAPDNRHPWYVDAYGGDTNSFDYIGHQFMVEMLRDLDPRTPYYLKRQTTTILDPLDPTDKQTIPCSQRTDCTYNYLVLNANISTLLNGNVPSDAVLAGYFGRDHGDPSGIPLDGALRTAPGVYPIGGLYDDTAEQATGNNGNGGGVFPAMTGWMVKFMLAEAALTGAASTGDAKALMSSAVEEQMAYVESISAGLDEDSEDMVQTDIDDYVALAESKYDAAANPLNVVLKQAWFANFGNGFEIYNAYRRTGYPNDLQTALQPVRGFPLRLPYTLDESNLNKENVPSTTYDVDKIFWDVN